MTIDSVSNQKINTLDLAAINAAANASQTKVAVDEVIPPVEQPANDESSGLPALAKPTTTVNATTLAGIALPSLGATVLALITDTADEARRANTEARKAQTEAIVQTIHSQADEMRSQATRKFGLGLASAVVQVASGTVSTAMTTAALNGKFAAPVLQAETQRIQAITQIIGGGKSVFDSVNEFVSAHYDIDIKRKDADIEKLRAHATQLDSLTDALKQVISKATSVQADIQANVNQTRTKILS